MELSTQKQLLGRCSTVSEGLRFHLREVGIGLVLDLKTKDGESGIDRSVFT